MHPLTPYEQMSMDIGQPNLAQLPPNYDLSGWSASGDRLNDLSTARAITGGSSSDYGAANTMYSNTNLHNHGESYNQYLRNSNANSANGTFYPMNNSAYNGNVSSYSNISDEVATSEINSRHNQYMAAAAYMRSTNMQAAYERMWNQYMSNAAYSQISNTTNGYTAGENFNMATETSPSSNNAYISSEMLADSFKNANVFSTTSVPKISNVEPITGDWVNYDIPLPKKKVLPKDHSFFSKNKNEVYSSSSSFETQPVRNNYRKLPGPIGDDKTTDLYSNYLSGLEILHEEETISETVSPAESETSGLSSFSGLSSHSSHTASRPDNRQLVDSFMKLRFKDEEKVVMNNGRNILDLGANLKPFNESFSAARLPSVAYTDQRGVPNPQYLNSRSLYERLADDSNSPLPTMSEPCDKCGYLQ